MDEARASNFPTLELPHQAGRTQRMLHHLGDPSGYRAAALDQGVSRGFFGIYRSARYCRRRYTAKLE